jgi:hypothetical protein
MNSLHPDGGFVLLHCVNRDCQRPLDSFSDGRLFHFDIVSISVPAVDEDRSEFDEIPKRKTVQFWLCGPCSETMTLALEPLDGLHLVPLQTSVSKPSLCATVPSQGHSAKVRSGERSEVPS